MSNLEAAEVFPPGEYIVDELESRGWTQQDLAAILDRPLNAVNQIITGKRSITPDTAKGLAAAFGTSPEFWMNLENAWQLWNAKEQDEDVAFRAKLFTLAPVNEMIRRGWIEGTNNVRVLESQVKRFFETDDLGTITQLEIAARKSGSYAETTPAQLAWFYRARWLARSVASADFDRNELTDIIKTMRAQTMFPENISKIPSILANVGIRLILVEPLQKTRIDGAAFWVDKKPVVALSLRFDRIDAFWHTLLHELVHIKNGDKRSIDSDLVGDARGLEAGTRLPDVEERTNVEACDLLIPADKLESFAFRTRPLYSKKAIIRFAQSIGVHPGIVVGQLQHRKEIPWTHSREMLVAIRQLILGKALTDGWGHTPGTLN
jgi:HTH-type transcriptional regulator / antitoxin HigA